ncbi:hypothetical protein D9M69_219750 [compost metagenome]
MAGQNLARHNAEKSSRRSLSVYPCFSKITFRAAYFSRGCRRLRPADPSLPARFADTCRVADLILHGLVCIQLGVARVRVDSFVNGKAYHKLAKRLDQ